MTRTDLFERPTIERQAPIAVGYVFNYAGRLLRVVRVHGEDAAAPVILEELSDFGTTLRGQYALWSRDFVLRASR